MGKVQFNCRLESEIAEWIAREALRLTASKGSKYSQADIIARLVIRCGMPASKRETEAKFTPAIEEKIKRNVTPKVKGYIPRPGERK